MKLYECGKQYNNKADLLGKIKTTTLETEPAEVKKKKLTKSMDNRLPPVIKKSKVGNCSRGRPEGSLFNSCPLG